MNTQEKIIKAWKEAGITSYPMGVVDKQKAALAEEVMLKEMLSDSEQISWRSVIIFASICILGSAVLLSIIFAA